MNAGWSRHGGLKVSGDEISTKNNNLSKTNKIYTCCFEEQALLTPKGVTNSDFFTLNNLAEIASLGSSNTSCRERHFLSRRYDDFGLASFRIPLSKVSSLTI